MKFRKSSCLSILLLGILICFFPFSANSEESEVEKRLKALEKNYRTLEKKYDDLQQKYETLKEEKAIPEAVVEEKVKPIEEEVKSVKEEVKSLIPGSKRFMLSGWGAASYINRDGDEQDSTFTARFAPIFLYQMFPNVLFEAELEFELEGDETEVGLEYAQIDYLFSKYSTATVGKFLTPFGVFPLKLHPAWINKMPNSPLMYRSGFLPFSNVGAQLSGAFAPPTDSFRITYGLALVNAGVLQINGEEGGGHGHGRELTRVEDEHNEEDENHDDEEVDEHDEDENDIITEVERIVIISDSVDITDKVGFVGRIGFIPFQNSVLLNGLEVGFSWLVEKVTLEDEDLVFSPGLQGLENPRNHFTFGFDWAYLYKGFTFRGEFAQSHLSLPDEIEDLEKQWGYYLQASYQPVTSGIPYLKDTEFVTRYDQRGGDRDDFKRKEIGFGLDFWLTSSLVAKATYFYIDNEVDENNHAFWLQVAYGF